MCKNICVCHIGLIKSRITWVYYQNWIKIISMYDLCVQYLAFFSTVNWRQFVFQVQKCVCCLSCCLWQVHCFIPLFFCTLFYFILFYVWCFNFFQSFFIFSFFLSVRLSSCFSFSQSVLYIWWQIILWSLSFSAAGLFFLLSSTFGSESGGESWMSPIFYR